MKRCLFLIGLIFLCPAAIFAEDEAVGAINENEIKFPSLESVFSDTDLEMIGFTEIRAGYRTREKQVRKDMSIMETRLQIDISAYTENYDFKLKGDFLGDMVLEQGDFDLREAFVFTRPTDDIDLKIGRQVLTWGTGDLLFINDLFPKDWQSFFTGRDVEYLKAPSDAVKLSWFSEAVNLDIVFTPKFDSDRYIRGEYISYYNPILSSEAGRNAIIHTNKPDSWLRDNEIALRLYKNIKDYETALYAYRGYWKSPGGFTSDLSQAVFPDLSVYGASIRGSVGKGIGNAEFGYYQSEDDQSGNDPLINNSELRFLVGYSQELQKNFTAAFQYYLEHIMDYSEHKDSDPVSISRDKNRHLLTLRLTRLLMNQNLKLSVFTYFSPSDKDVYMRPNVNYKATDNLSLEVGANVFFGDYPDTFFGQFENNTNIYTAVRYYF